jgi:acetyl-CoA/propionyl-CoA carboxylase biotin carboxyl carrier protein
VWAPSRDNALARLKYALDETVLLGLGSNLNYLRALADDPLVHEGRVHTGYLAEKFGDFAPIPSEGELKLVSAAQAEGLGRALANSGEPTAQSTQYASPFTANWKPL